MRIGGKVSVDWMELGVGGDDVIRLRASRSLSDISIRFGYRDIPVTTDQSRKKTTTTIYECSVRYFVGKREVSDTHQLQKVQNKRVTSYINLDCWI